MSNRLMIDLETLSTRDDAAIVAIGAAAFDDHQILETAHWPLSFKNLTGHIDPATVLWWMQQSKEAQQATFADVGRVRPFLAGQQLYDLVKRHDCQTVWANDPHFDVVLIQNWWRRYREDAPKIAPVGVEMEPCIGVPWPFKYNQPRSYRTIVELAKNHGFTDQLYDAAKGMHVAHCAVDDAAAQARVVIACETWLQSGGSSHQLTQGLLTKGEQNAPGSWRNGLPV